MFENKLKMSRYHCQHQLNLPYFGFRVNSNSLQQHLSQLVQSDFVINHLCTVGPDEDLGKISNCLTTVPNERSEHMWESAQLFAENCTANILAVLTTVDVCVTFPVAV